MRTGSQLQITLLVAVFALLLAPGALAIGMAVDYLKDNTLILEPGGTATYGIRMQNPSSEDVWVRVGIESTGEIATIVDAKERYLLEAGTYKNAVSFKIHAPEDAKRGSTYEVGYYMAPESGGSGNIPFGIRIERSFTVKVRDFTPEELASIRKRRIMTVLGALALVGAALGILVYLRRRNR